MEVSLEKLRRIFDRLCENLEENGIGFVRIESDYYWHIPDDARYDPYREPEALNLGQLSDDILLLEKLITGDREPIGLDWVHFAAILEAIGNTHDFHA
jgi:hypothetical protein